jgi:hypothetical protein
MQELNVVVESAELKSRSRDRVQWPKFFAVFRSFSRQMPVQCLKLGGDWFHSFPF